MCDAFGAYNPHLTCSVDPGKRLRWSTERMDEADQAAGCDSEVYYSISQVRTLYLLSKNERSVYGVLSFASALRSAESTFVLHRSVQSRCENA